MTDTFPLGSTKEVSHGGATPHHQPITASLRVQSTGTETAVSARRGAMLRWPAIRVMPPMLDYVGVRGDWRT